MRLMRSASVFSLFLFTATAAVFGAGNHPALGSSLAGTPTATATICPTPAPTSTCSAPTGTPTVSAINFLPPNPTIDNPEAQGSMTRARTITVKMMPYDTEGRKISPSGRNPLYVTIFGAPSGTISQTTIKITSGRKFSFRYNGGYLPNDLVMEAWIKNPNPSETLGVYSIGTTLILRTNRQSPTDCTYQTASFAMSTDCPSGTVPGSCSNMTQPNGIQISAAIGLVPSGAPTSSFEQYTVDTGSLGLLVPQKQVPAANPSPGETQIIGPGGPELRYYDSNGGTCYQGQYWLAPVTFGLSSNGGTMTNTVTTHPVRILVVPDSHPLNYLGVGYDRNTTTSGDYFDSPADNAFLNLTDTASGTDISPGYTITPTQITLGVTSSAGFNTTPLQANQCVAGDYLTSAGCFSFPALSPEEGTFCGTMLMDTGIGDMYLNLYAPLWPAHYCESGLVPNGTVVQINSGTSTSSPPMCYRYAVNNDVPTPEPTPVTPAPSITNCIENPTDTTIKFVNTGRHPLAWFDYMYDAACGQVGFMPNADYQATCP